MITQHRPAPANVVILGCGRSGTSIFGELFEAIPGYTYYSEPFLADVPCPASGPIAVKVPRTAVGSSPPTGASASLDDLRSVVPDPTIFWQVRHPFDAICSLRVGIAQKWAHHPRPPDWQDWIDRPLVERCAHHWATINGAGYALVRGEAVVSRFEDMIRDPVTCAVTTCRLVGGDTTAPELVAWAYSIGFNFVSHASDLGLLMNASKTGISRIRELSANASMTDPPTITAPTPSSAKSAY